MGEGSLGGACVYKVTEAVVSHFERDAIAVPDFSDKPGVVVQDPFPVLEGAHGHPHVLVFSPTSRTALCARQGETDLHVALPVIAYDLL
jgi:hypothetical protein